MLCLRIFETCACLRTHRCLTQALSWGLGLAVTIGHAAPPDLWEGLQQQALGWVSTQPAFQGRDLHLVPPDQRIAIQPCQQPLQFDQPFPAQSSVRVRCVQPGWQLFVTLAQGSGVTPPTRPEVSAPPRFKVLVSSEFLKRGALVSPTMFTVTDMPAAGMEQQLISDPRVLVHQELVRDLPPNTPLKTYDLKNAVLIKRGLTVSVTAGAGAGSSAGFQITLRAEALQDGAIGDTIRLKNTESGRFLSAEVTGPGTATIR